MYFKILALSDMLVLIICVGLITSLTYLIIHLEENKIRLCPLLVALWFAKELGPEISPWIIVTLSVERALSMMFPLKFTGQFAKKRALISFGCIMVVLVLLQFIWIVSVQFGENQDTCILTLESASSMTTRITYIKILVLCALPIFFIIICNALIVFRLFRMRKMGLVANVSQRNRRCATFTVLTFVTGILHCVSVIPTVFVYIALHCVLTVSSVESLPQMWCWTVISNHLFWAFLQEMFVYINNSFNFYFYCLAGRDFRADLKDILCCRNRTANRTNKDSPIEM
jgi:hypothetical protein